MLIFAPKFQCFFDQNLDFVLGSPTKSHAQTILTTYTTTVCWRRIWIWRTNFLVFRARFSKLQRLNVTNLAKKNVSHENFFQHSNFVRYKKPEALLRQSRRREYATSVPKPKIVQLKAKQPFLRKPGLQQISIKFEASVKNTIIE